jgi:hypothetical protein
MNGMFIKKFFVRWLLFEADAGSGGAGAGTGEKPKSFEVWIESQPEDIKTLYSEHTSGLKSALQKEREANEKAKKDQAKLAELEAKEKERADKEKSEMDKLTERATTAEAEREAAKAETEKANQKLKAERIRTAIIAEAGRVGFIDTEDAYTLLDKTAIQIDDKDAVTGVPEAVKKLAEAKPHLLGQAKSKGDGVGTPRSGLKKKEEKTDEKRVPVIRSL